MNIDHARVYFDAQLASEETDPQRRHLHGGSYLPSLLFIEEVYDEPDPEEAEETWFWSHVTDSAVLNYCYFNPSYFNLDNSGNSEDLSHMERVLTTTAQNDNLELARTATTLIKKDGLRIYDVRSIMFASMKGNKDILTILYDLFPVKEQILEIVLRSRRPELWSVVREGLFDRPRVPSEVFSDLLSDGHTKALDFYFQVEPEIVHSLDWKKIATSDHCVSSVRQLKYLKEKVGLSSPGNTILIAATPYLELFRMVLSDPSVDPTIEHEKVIRGAFEGLEDMERELSEVMGTQSLMVSNSVAQSDMDSIETVLMALLNHPSFRLEELTLTSTRLLGYGLLRIIGPRDEAMAVASSVYAPERAREFEHAYEELSALLEGEDGTLTLIVRAVCFLDLDIIPLGEWMLKCGNTSIYRACNSIVERYVPQDREEQIIAGLLLFFLYSDMTLEEYIHAREKEEMDEKNILLSVQLIGLVLGDDISQRLD